jgi:hypothetical protein
MGMIYNLLFQVNFHPAIGSFTHFGAVIGNGFVFAFTISRKSSFFNIFQASLTSCPLYLLPACKSEAHGQKDAATIWGCFV